MTEYDYSPDAVERYYAKLNSVARWVDRQASEAHAYGNPFVPSDRGDEKEAGTTSYVPQVKNLSRSVSNSVDARAATNNARMYAPNAQPRRHSRSQSVANASTPNLVQAQPRHSTVASSHSQSQSQSHSRSSARSHSRPPPARSQTYLYASQPAYAGAGSGQPHGASSYPARSATLPAQATHYAAAPGQPVVMQQGRQTYVLVPPHGARVEVHSPQNVSPVRITPVTSVYASPISPTKKQPLLKRLFNNSNSTRRVDVPIVSGSSRRRTTSMHY